MAYQVPATFSLAKSCLSQKKRIRPLNLTGGFSKVEDLVNVRIELIELIIFQISAIAGIHTST